MDGTQIWRITHNGADTHPIHRHLYDVQLLNRVTWDNIIVPPDATELGWKDRVTASLLALALSLLCGVSSVASPTAYLGAAPAPVTALATQLLYAQTANPAGGLLLSSLCDPDGSAYDQWMPDAFTLIATGDITEIHWSGGYDPTRGGMGQAVQKFRIEIYPSIAAGTAPDIAHPPLVHYEIIGNAGETGGAVLGGRQIYNDAYVLPTAFHAVGGVKYRVQIEACLPVILVRRASAAS